MIKNKGLRLLLTFIITAVTAVIANFIDLAFDTNGNLILASLFSGIILIFYSLHMDIIDEDPLTIIVRFFKNVLLVLLVGAFVIFLLLGALPAFGSIETDGRLIFSMLIATVLTFFLINFSNVLFSEEVFWGLYPYFVLAITAISFALSLLISLLGSLAFIPSIVFIVVGVISLIVAFKKDYLAFISPKHAKIYMPSSGNYSNDDNSEKKQGNGGIRRVMLNVCSSGIPASKWLPNNNYYSPRVNWHLDPESDDTVVVEIGGSIYIHDSESPNNDYKDIARTVDGYRDDIKKQVKNNYQSYTKSAIKDGVDCSRIR
ncbi:MAG: hypothetical protein J6V68_03055, partial [Clostridia bacterium]|nr:hypothetical protein [Clostridia bacterium]